MQKNKRKIFLVGGIIAAAAVIMSGCQTKTASEQTGAEDDRPHIMVGCDDYTPFSYMDVDGNVTGIDVELAREAFDRIGYQADFTFINWEDKKKLLKDGSIDCVWSSFTMDGRETEYKWAGPYMKSKQVVAVNIDSDIYTLNDLEGKTVAVQSTTKPEDLFRSHEAGLPELRKIISVKNRDVLFTFLSKGYVDAIAAHDTSIVQFSEDFDMEYRILEEPLLNVNLGVAFDLDDDRGIDEQLSQAIKEMRKDGTIEDIVSEYLPGADRYLEDADEK